METLFYLLIALLALSILIFFHELGHYLAARFFGVKIEKFSIGFGKVLFEKECCSTKWAISAIPLGGYVKMKGQDDTNPTLKNSDPDSYNSKKPWQRIIILLAGPFGNIFIAFVLYFLIALFNAPLVTALDYLPPKIGQVSKDSPAKVANLKPQDQILEINGKKIKYWYEIKDLVENSNGDISLKIKRENKILAITLKPKVIEDKNIFNEIVERKIIGIAPYINGIKEIK
ncbi:MAG: RIP metalloprotease RseP, partial [Epsilonproteobacteria bacterium]|nr:RIP metalloprotease RseP [Campylobacterota bacterium]